MINFNLTKKDIISLDWLIKARTDSFAILLILTPPFYFLWLLKIGTFTAKRRGKSSGIFKLSILLVIICSSTILFFSQDFDTLIMQTLIGIIMVSWLYACIFAATTVVKYEFRNKDELPQLMDYIHRFGQILYWIFGIWVLQPKLNEFLNDE